MSMFGWLESLFSRGGSSGAILHVVGTEAGEPVTEAAALSLPVVSACLDIRAGLLSSLPLQVFRRRDDGGREPASDHPLAYVLARRPNAWQSSWDWRQQMQRDVDWHRNAYAEIIPGERGAVSELERLDPAVTWPEWIGGSLWYHTWSKKHGTRLLAAEEVFHLRCGPFTDDGLMGRPVLVTHADTLGAALAVHRYGQRFFRNNGEAGGILEHPSFFKDRPARDAFMESWRQARTGKHQHRDALLEFGIKYVRIQLDNEKAQFLETRKENALEVARIWRIPPHKIGMLDRATFSNIEHQALEFLSDTALPVLEMWEQKINLDLIPDEDHYVEFNVAGLLRGDLKSQAEAFKMGREGGWLSINDVRRMLNLNPIANGDDHLQPLNMAPAGTRPDEAKPADRPA